MIYIPMYRTKNSILVPGAVLIDRSFGYFILIDLLFELFYIIMLYYFVLKFRQKLIPTWLDSFITSFFGNIHLCSFFKLHFIMLENLSPSQHQVIHSSVHPLLHLQQALYPEEGALELELISVTLVIKQENSPQIECQSIAGHQAHKFIYTFTPRDNQQRVCLLAYIWTVEEKPCK